MDFSTIIQSAVAMIGVLGGFEAIKYFINRKPNARIAEAEADIKEAEADMAELNVLRETNTFLQAQMKSMAEENADKERRFVEQTTRLRETQDREYKLMLEKSALELELQKYRCMVPKCANRQPKNGF